MNEATTGVHLWLLLMKAHRAVEAHALRSVEAQGICLSDFGVLEALLHKGPLSAGALGGKISLTSGSVTAAIDRLESRGLVERRGDDRDRRTRIVHLTPDGRKLIRRLFERHESDMARAVSLLSAGELESLARGLRKLGRSAEDTLNDKA